MPRHSLLWAIFAIFVAMAGYFHGSEALFQSNGALPAGKCLAWLAFAGFLGYSMYCSRRENIFQTIRQISTYDWGRQICIDLYLGLSLMLCLVYLTERSVWVVLAWLLPTVLFANLATLLYVATHYDAIVSHFLP